MNPALPLDVFIPDSEARQWADGRLYVYGSLDVSGDSAYCSRDYRVFSSEDLVHWTDHGVSFTTHESLDEPWGEATLYAPDCVRYRDEYRLFFCTSDNGEGVARSSDPAGPFGDPHPIVGAHADAIDPAAFIDDDGTPYLFWGQFNARGARLRDDLTAIDPETFNPSLVNEAEHGFHEGA
ncbi:MAG TPA: family 43 glycosylhydrolase, partial [Spirochaetia bacterium]|nr:family 43 glycosylhydrolase [Spirochaetia bacterium]